MKIALLLLLVLITSCQLVTARNSAPAQSSDRYENARPVEYKYDNNVRCYVVYWYNYQGSAGGISCVVVP